MVRLSTAGVAAATIGLGAAFTHRNDNVDFQYIPPTRDTPGGYYDVCPLHAYVEINPAQAPMNITDCGCPVGSSLRPTGRSEYASYVDQDDKGESVQCVSNDELMCIDCAAYVALSASQKIDTLWEHSLRSALVEPTDTSKPCETSIANCVYKSDVSLGNELPADALLHGSTAQVQGRDTFPRFSSLYTESMDASFDRYSDVLPKGRVKAIHNHAVIAQVDYLAHKTATIANELPIGTPTKNQKRPTGLMDTGSKDCILRLSISHPINTTVNMNNGMLVSTALKCARDGTYSGNILGLQDARGQGDHQNYFFAQLKNWVPSYTPHIENFDGVGPNAERFGTSTDAPLRMGLDQFTSADASGVPISPDDMSQPEILYWVPNGCDAEGEPDAETGLVKEKGSCKRFDSTGDYAQQQADGNHFASFSDTERHDFRDDLIKLPPKVILYDLYAPSGQACYCDTIDKDLFGWGKEHALKGSNQPCPVILSDDASLKCDKNTYPYVKVGQVVSRTKAHMSGFSDTRMFFQHARWGKKENHVCKFDEPVANNNKGTVNPSRFSHDHTLSCVAGSGCPGGSHEITDAMMQNPKATAEAAKQAGCPFANFLDSKHRFAGEAVKREEPSFRCPANAFAKVTNPASMNDCACFEGYAKIVATKTCEANGPYTAYNPAGVTEFAGFEISVPKGKLQSTADWYTAVLGFKLESKATVTLPGGVEKMTQMLRLKTDDGSVGVLLAEQANSQPVSGANFYGIHAITFSVQDARNSHDVLAAMNSVDSSMLSDVNSDAADSQGTTTFTLTDPNGVTLHFTQDAEGGQVSMPALPSFWETPPPTQPTLVTSAISSANPVGIGRIRDSHDLVAETSAAQIWAQDMLGMALWQFETPELEYLALNFNDCYDNSQKRVSDKECLNAARMFPAATVGLGQVRLHYKYCTVNCSAGFVNPTGNPSHVKGAPTGSFIRPPPPFHSHYHGISQITLNVQSMSRTLKYLSSRNVDLINPTNMNGEQEVFIATNQKTYMKFRQQAVQAAPPAEPDGKGGESSGRTSSAVIALACVCGFGVAGVAAVNIAARRKKGGFSSTRSASSVQLGTLPSTSATSNPAYDEQAK